MDIRHTLKIYVSSWKLQLRAAAALRGAFWMQIIGMVINNTALLVAWLFMFHHFGTIHGWSIKEMIGMQGINMIVFGIVMLSSAGIMDLPRHVDRGSFDGMLVKPQPVLFQLGSSNIDVTTIGDFALGLLLTGWYVAVSPLTIGSLLLFLGAMFIGLIVLWCLMILLPNVLAFYVYDSETLNRNLGFMFLDSGLYPTGVLSGTLRTLLLTVFPGLLIGAVQVEVLRRFDWQEVAIGAVVALLWLVFSLWLFKRSIRRYESSNLVGAR
jgi:ABC-2 type transport system permease protein